MSRRQLEDPNKATAYMREWAQTDAGVAYRERHKAVSKQWREDNKERFQAQKRSSEHLLRFSALTYYSTYYSGTDTIPECRCCGETVEAFLHMDHIDGDGAAHNRAINAHGGAALYQWLKDNNYPEGFQVLCANCNLGKREGKHCPHEYYRGVDLNGNVLPEEAYPEAVAITFTTKARSTVTPNRRKKDKPLIEKMCKMGHDLADEESTLLIGRFKVCKICYEEGMRSGEQPHMICKKGHLLRADEIYMRNGIPNCLICKQDRKTSS